MDEYQVDFVLENVKEEDNRFVFTAKSITKDFVCEAGLERLANDSSGKHVVWRHEHPLIPKYKSTHIYGTVLESRVEDGGIISTYEVYGHTDEHLKARRIITERMELKKPISISMRYRQYGEDDPIHFDVVEHSLTPTPACKTCKVIDILNESENMTKTEEEMLKEIEELEKELTKKDKLYEELTEKIVVVEKKFEELTEETKVKDEELEQEKTDKDKIAEQILEFKDKLNEQTKVIDELKETNAMKDIEPLINNLIELDGKEMEELYRMKAKNAYKAGDKAFEEAKSFLKERSKLRESQVHAVTTDLDETANKAQITDEELEDKDLANKRDKRAFANMPEKFFEWREKVNK